MKIPQYILCVLLLLWGLIACNRSIEIEQQAPSIVLSQTEYRCTEGSALTVIPMVEHAQDAVFGWWMETGQVASTLILTYTFETAGTYYLTFKVTASSGTAQTVIRVTVTAEAPPQPPLPPDTTSTPPEPPQPPDTLQPPVIRLTSSFTVKVADTLHISPEVEHAQEAVYAWTCGTDTLAHTLCLEHAFAQPGTYALTFSVQTPGGRAQQEVCVTVLERTPPVITLVEAFAIPVCVPRGQSVTFTATVRYDDQNTFAWYLDGVRVSTDLTYVFEAETVGAYTLKATASNADGTAAVEISIEVRDLQPMNIEFITSSLDEDILHPHLFAGQYLYVLPNVKDVPAAAFEWVFNGKTVGTQPVLFYAPPVSGTLHLKVTDPSDPWRRIDTTITVTLHGNQAAGKRPATGGSSAAVCKVYQYLPAPGQFINEDKSGFGGVSTPQQACDYAYNRLQKEQYVSLGAFGGSIVVGFDHSITGFSIASNALANSSEPGVVWVMQDTNGDGLPNDRWFELKGSEYGNKSVYTACRVTYYRPSGVGQLVKWTDNYGRSGVVPYMAAYHGQPFYYPLWVTEDSYTLQGTWLPLRHSQDPVTGQWSNLASDWGYADNYGKDYDPQTHRNRFDLSHAIYPNGEPARLEYIDFVKVQTGTQGASGSMGEQSTEVCGFYEE